MKKFLSAKRLLSLIMAAVLMILGAVSAYAASIEELEERQRELEQQNAEYQAKLDESQAKVDQQQDYVDALVGKVQTVNEEITVIRQKISALDEDIKEKQRQINEKNDEIEDGLNTLRQRLREIYMAGEIRSLEIILGAKNFSDFLDKIQIAEYISKHDEKLINEVEAQLDVIRAEEKALQDEKKEQQAEQQKLEEKKAELNALLDENKEVLANLQAATDEVQLQLELSEEELSNLDEEIQDYYRRLKEEEERRRQEEEERRRQQEEQGGSSSDTPSYDTPSHTDVPSDGGWVWPVPGYYDLSSVFYEERSYEYHGGIDIISYSADIMNAPIFAAASGTVISTNYGCTHNWGKYYSCGCGGGYGNYVWISHGDGKETIYGHMTTPVVNTGDYVTAGQLIGYVGSTGFSTGAHLHFEARYYGERYDPMSEYN